MTNVADLTSVEKIIVLDFGSQFNQLITRRIREFGVFSELLSHRTTAEEIRKIAPKGIIFSGGPNSVYDKDAFSIDPEIYELGIPILGICYGMQLMTHNLGGKVEPAANREYGKAELEILGDATLFQGTPAKQTVWMSHGDLVTEIAPGFEKVGTSNDCPIASIEDANRNSTAYNFTQKFVIQNMVTTYYVTLLLMCVAVLVTGAWKTSSIWKSLKSVNK